MKTDKPHGSAKSMFESLKNDPKAIIDWCDREISEYQALKKIIKRIERAVIVSGT